MGGLGASSRVAWPPADYSRNGQRLQLAHVRGPPCACKLQRKRHSKFELRGPRNGLEIGPRSSRG
eukprot:5167176-Alexandrium_andersonii.AAC.1